MGFTNLEWCFSDSLTPQQPSKQWWTICYSPVLTNGNKRELQAHGTWMTFWSHHETKRPTNKQCMNSLNTRTKWPVPQTRKMCLGTTKCWLSGANPWRGGNMHGPCQSCRHCKLANPKNCQTSSIIPGILQLLSTLYILILTHSKTPERTNQEGHHMGLGDKTTKCLQNPSEVYYIGTSVKTTSIRPKNWSLSGHFRILHRGSLDAKRQNRQKTPSCLFL